MNPHAPYTPPAPFDTAFLDAQAARGPVLQPVNGFHGGVRAPVGEAARDRLGYYVAQYDGEIAAVDAEVGHVLEALERSAVRDQTLVLLTSDHGESLGEHDYFFDHGENLFDPSLRIPLVLAGPGIERGRRSSELASTLDIVPTLLDAVKVSYPPDLAGVSLLGAARGEPLARQRLPRAERPQPARGLRPALQAGGDAERERVELRALRPRARSGRDARRSARRTRTSFAWSGASWSCSVRGSMLSS